MISALLLYSYGGEMLVCCVAYVQYKQRWVCCLWGQYKQRCWCYTASNTAAKLPQPHNCKLGWTTCSRKTRVLWRCNNRALDERAGSWLYVALIQCIKAIPNATLPCNDPPTAILCSCRYAFYAFRYGIAVASALELSKVWKTHRLQACNCPPASPKLPFRLPPSAIYYIYSCQGGRRRK